MARRVAENRILWPGDLAGRPRKKTYRRELKSEFTGFSTVVGFTADGTKELAKVMGPSVPFKFPKPISLIQILVEQTCSAGEFVLDYFAGSGTTAAAVVDMDRGLGGDARKFIAVEMGDHFDTVLVPRIRRTIFSDEWVDGVPVRRAGASHAVKILELESYDDTLDNIMPKGVSAHEELFDSNRALREDYILRYMLDLEAEGSLLNLERFRKPWDYTIKVRRDGVVQDSPVDLVETFNYLIGLRVKRYETYGQEGLLFVTGTDPEGHRVIVVWRDCDLWPNDRLEEKCRQAFESFRPDEFDLVYVNGDNHLPIIKTGEESWKVNLIEETFHARMFDTSDVE